MRLVCRDRHHGRSHRPHVHVGTQREFMERPAGFMALWQWAVGEAKLAERDAPLQLHSRDYPPIRYDRDGRPIDDGRYPGRWRVRRRPDIIGGLPFSSAFEQYMEDRPTWTHVRRALKRLGERNSGGLEHRICWAIIAGQERDPMAVQARLRCSDEVFQKAAVSGLETLWDLAMSEIEHDLRAQPEVLTPAGSAVS